VLRANLTCFELFVESSELGNVLSIFVLPLVEKCRHHCHLGLEHGGTADDKSTQQPKDTVDTAHIAHERCEIVD